MCSVDDARDSVLGIEEDNGTIAASGSSDNCDFGS